ncbi:MAG TPA: PAS domain S-box protein, partial [Flavobacterium sp.]|nr:PAS domain S-box protein [Flavobacterium sp.]
MRFSVEKKILAGFIINLILVIALAIIFVMRFDEHRNTLLDETLNFVELTLFVLSAVLLVIVYLIIRSQLRRKNISEEHLLENKQLLKSIIDNTTNPIFIKRINGEYLLVNKQYEILAQTPKENIIGKTGNDFLPPEIAEDFRNTDLEVVKQLKELKTEQTLQQADGPHTYIVVKFPLYDSTGRIYAIGGIATDISDRKKIEDSIKFAAHFFDISSDIMAIGDKDKFIKINPATVRILGYSEQELLNQPFINFIHPDDRESTRREVSKLDMGLSSLNFENRNISKDGTIRWFEWTANADTKSGLIYAVGREITAKKETEKSLAISDKFFNMSFDIFTVAKGDFFIKINPAFTKILGYNQDDLDKKPFLEFMHPDDLKVAVDGIEKLKKTDTVINFRARMRTKEGSFKWLDWTATIDRQTGVMFGLARDVTDLIVNEKSINLSNKFFNMAFDIFTVIKDERFIKVNPAFENVLGYNQSDLDSIKFSDLTHPDDKSITDEVLAKLSKGEPNVKFIERLRAKDGTYKWLNWYSNYDVSQATLYSVARDITETVLLEDEQKKINKELYENEEKLRLVIENISEGVIVVNTAKEVIISNEMAGEILDSDDDKVPYDLTSRFELLQSDEKTTFPYQNLPMEKALAGQETDDVDL